VADDDHGRRDPNAIAIDLAARWAGTLINKSWPERYELMRQMHEQMQDDMEDLQLYAEVSPRLIKRIIDELPGGPVTSLEQAHIYANSADKAHRDAAGAWLARHAAPKKTAGQ
jgi:hypothetical protein